MPDPLVFNCTWTVTTNGVTLANPWVATSASTVQISPGTSFVTQPLGLHVTSGLPRYYQPVMEDPVQAEARRHAAACRKLDRTPAGAKAWALLREHLTPRQREQCGDAPQTGPVIRGSFRVVGSEGGDYQIERGYPNGNVMRFKPNAAVFCLHPVEPYPTDDIVLAQKLLLEADESLFTELANVTMR